MTTSEYTCCSKCGQAISRAYYFKGLPYGPKCIDIVTGVPFDRSVFNSDGEFDAVATAERERVRDEKFAKFKKNESERVAKCDAVASSQKWLSDFLNSTGFGFALSIARDLESGFPFSQLPDRAKNIVADIYAKANGRRNSKAYNTAIDEFWSRIEKL